MKTRKIRGGMFAVRGGPTASKVLSLFAKRPATAAAKLAPTSGMLSGMVGQPLLNPQQRMKFATGAQQYPVFGIGELGKAERTEAKQQKTGNKDDISSSSKVMYSEKTFPILDAYTAHHIMKIKPVSLLGCYKKVFKKEPEFPFDTTEEFRLGFFADLKAAGKLVMKGDGIVPEEISKKVILSPDATLYEGYEAGKTIVPTISEISTTIQKTADIIPPERIFPATLQQQATLFIEQNPELKSISRIFIAKEKNIKNVTSYLRYEPSANVFLKANEDLHRVVTAALADGFDVNAFNKLFTEARITKLKAGILNFWAKGDKQAAFANLDKIILCVKYDVFTPMNLDGYLSTLNTTPSKALDEINKLYDASTSFQRKIGEAPVLEEIKSKTWHWYKYTTQGKIAGILAILLIMAAMHGIYSLWDAQRAAAQIGHSLEVTRRTEEALQELKIIGETIQQKALEPVQQTFKPVTESVSKGYQDITADTRRRQYALYRWYNALKEKLSGGVRKTRKLRHS